MSMTDFNVVAAGDRAIPAQPFVARHLIDGEWRASVDGATFERVSPSHGTVITLASKGDSEDVERAVSAARSAFDKGTWSGTSGKERATLLLRVADLIDRERDRIALMETLESGKPISQAKSEIEGPRTCGATRPLWRARCTVRAIIRSEAICSAWF